MIAAVTQDVILHTPLREGIPVGLYLFGIAAVSYIGGRIVGFSDGARWGRAGCRSERRRRAAYDAADMTWASSSIPNAEGVLTQWGYVPFPPESHGDSDQTRPFDWGKDVKPSVLKAVPK